MKLLIVLTALLSGCAQLTNSGGYVSPVKLIDAKEKSTPTFAAARWKIGAIVATALTKLALMVMKLLKKLKRLLAQNVN